MKPRDAIVTGFFFTVGAACAVLLIFELVRALFYVIPGLHNQFTLG